MPENGNAEFAQDSRAGAAVGYEPVSTQFRC